jgi:hypothetical protein
MAIPAASKVERYAISNPKKLKQSVYNTEFNFELADSCHNTHEEVNLLTGHQSALSPNLECFIEPLGPSYPQRSVSYADNLNRNLSMNCLAPQNSLSLQQGEPRFFTLTKHYLAMPILYRRFGVGAETDLPDAER